MHITIKRALCLIPMGEYMCFRQTKSESSIALLYSEKQARLYVLELYL